MIQIGDLVRIKNSHVRASGWTHFSRRRKRDWKSFRGKSKIYKVVKILNPGGFDRNGWCDAVVQLDKPIRDDDKIRHSDILSTFWLVLHRRGKAS